MGDQRTRTLEALERRFAQAEAELQTQQLKGKKRPIEDKERLASKTKSSFADSRVKKPFSSVSSKRGLSWKMIIFFLLHFFYISDFSCYIFFFFLL